MKLTKEQRYYIERKLSAIYRTKSNEITQKYSYLYSLTFARTLKVPEEIQEHYNALITFCKTQEQERQDLLQPLDLLYEQAKEKLLFADNYEAVKDLLTSFEEQLK